MGSLAAVPASKPECEIACGAATAGRPVGVDTLVADPAEKAVCVSARRAAIARNVTTETKNDDAGTNACRPLAAWFGSSCEASRNLAMSLDCDAADAGNATAHRNVESVGSNTRHTRPVYLAMRAVP